jgi:two-component sensor histidine kinase
VTVTLQQIPEGRILLTLGDNGVGLPLDLDWKNGQSLGLRLVQMLAGQLRAEVGLEREGGTKFRIIFHLPKSAKDGEPLHG